MYFNPLGAFCFAPTLVHANILIGIIEFLFPISAFIFQMWRDGLRFSFTRKLLPSARLSCFPFTERGTCLLFSPLKSLLVRGQAALGQDVPSRPPGETAPLLRAEQVPQVHGCPLPPRISGEGRSRTTQEGGRWIETAESKERRCVFAKLGLVSAMETRSLK